MKKILIISVSAGSGHTQAAKAIEKSIRQSFEDTATVHHIDMLEHVSWFPRWWIRDLYGYIIQHFPIIWKNIYNHSNTQKGYKKWIRIFGIWKTLSAHNFIHSVKEYNPTDIICTHPFAAQALCDAGLPAKFSIVLTDYEFHYYWKIPHQARYYVPSEEIKNEARGLGISEKDIVVSGIPIDPKFYEQKDTDTLIQKYRFSLESIKILFLSGGYGFTAIDAFIKKLIEQRWNTPLEIIAIAGKNKKLYKKLLDIQKKHSSTLGLHIIGWTDHIDEYMRIADIIITKSGGLTTTEALTLGKYILITNPLPGQEYANARYIVKNSSGKIVHSTQDIIDNIHNYKKTSKIYKKNDQSMAALVIGKDILKKR